MRVGTHNLSLQSLITVIRSNCEANLSCIRPCVMLQGFLYFRPHPGPEDFRPCVSVVRDTSNAGDVFYCASGTPLLLPHADLPRQSDSDILNVYPDAILWNERTPHKDLFTFLAMFSSSFEILIFVSRIFSRGITSGLNAMKVTLQSAACIG